MNITINGEKKDFTTQITVAQLLLELGIDSRKVAVEKNLNLVRRIDFEKILISDNDNIEIINFVGGG